VTGGLSNVPAIRRMLGQRLGTSIRRADPEAGMRGAAMLAAVAAGWFRDVTAAAQGMRYRRA
jgi:sugar (pentulose or hexulose) kinase